MRVCWHDNGQPLVGDLVGLDVERRALLVSHESRPVLVSFDDARFELPTTLPPPHELVGRTVAYRTEGESARPVDVASWDDALLALACVSDEELWRHATEVVETEIEDHLRAQGRGLPTGRRRLLVGAVFNELVDTRQTACVAVILHVRDDGTVEVPRGESVDHVSVLAPGTFQIVK